MAADMRTALPYDLLVDIFRRLEATAVIRCAATCRPWRRAIIDNASCLRPRPDCFNPNLLIGFLEKNWDSGRHTLRRLQYVSASNTSVPSFTPAVGVDDDVVDDGRPHSDLVSSRDGFLLFQGEIDNSLRLCRPLAGTCRALPAAALDKFTGSCVYVMVTSYDVVGDDSSESSDDGNGNETPAVWMLAADSSCAAEDGVIVTYQIFSSTAGAWGLIKRSAKLPEEAADVYMNPRDGVVCRDIVYWLIHLVPCNANSKGTCRLFAMDLRTERLWTIGLPALRSMTKSLVLASSEDGRLSLVKMFTFLHQMEVWVLGGDDQWTLRRTVKVQNLIPNCPSIKDTWLFGFCPRSGCLFGMIREEQDISLQHHLLIGVEGNFAQLIGRIDFISQTRLPYEMDWSTYISTMKYF